MINDADINLDNVTEGTTNRHFTDAEKTKLAGIEPEADVTDAENVAAAGAVMKTDTNALLWGFVVNEDTMVSDSDTKVPTQQSVKAYVDSKVADAVTSEMSYIGGYDASLAAPDGTANKGDMYTVTAAGNGAGYFTTTTLEVGDVIISQKLNPDSEADWTVVQKNLDGAVLESTTSTAAMGFVIDEDTMASDSDTKVPTQQSVKKYVDTQIDTVDLQEATDNGSATTNMIDITGGQDLGGGIETSLKIANNSMISMGGTDGAVGSGSGAFLSNDENPGNPNNGVTVQVSGSFFQAASGNQGLDNSTIMAVPTTTQLMTMAIGSDPNAYGKIATGITSALLETNGSNLLDQTTVRLADREIIVGINDNTGGKSYNVLYGNTSETALKHDTTALTLTSAGAAFNGYLSVGFGTSINDISTDGTLSDNSDDALPTQQAVKTYVDTEVSANSSVVTLQAVTTSTAIYDASADIITVNNAGAVTLTIPTAWITDSQNKKVVIKDISGAAGTNNITLATQGSETIDGAASFVIDNNYEAITLFSDGTNLYVV